MSFPVSNLSSSSLIQEAPGSGESPKRKSDEDINLEPKRQKNDNDSQATNQSLTNWLELPRDLWVQILLLLTNTWQDFNKYRLVNRSFKVYTTGPEIVTYLLSKDTQHLSKENNRDLKFIFLQHFGKNIPRLKLNFARSSLFSSVIQDDHLTQIANLCTDLYSINLSGCRHITKVGFQALTKFTTLQKINLSKVVLTTEIFDSLKNLPLKSLTLNHSNSSSKDLNLLSGITSLLKLSLINCHIKPKTLENFKKLSLKTLKVSYEKQLSIQGLNIIAQMNSLNTLVLDSAKILDAQQLSNLSILPLKKLTLGECPGITAKGLQAFSQLEQLTLVSCEKLENSVFVDPLAFPHLKKLFLNDCRQLTYDVLAHFQKYSKLETLKIEKCFKLTTEVPYLDSNELFFSYPHTNPNLNLIRASEEYMIQTNQFYEAFLAPYYHRICIPTDRCSFFLAIGRQVFLKKEDTEEEVDDDALKSLISHQIADFISQNADLYRLLISEDAAETLEKFIANLKEAAVETAPLRNWGEFIVLDAIQKCYQMPILIFSSQDQKFGNRLDYDAHPLPSEPYIHTEGDLINPIRLLFNGAFHYDVLIPKAIEIEQPEEQETTEEDSIEIIS